MAGKKMLIVATSHDTFPTTGEPTGLWLEELAAPYLAFKKAGMTVDVVSAKGGKIPLDPHSLQGAAVTAETKEFMDDSSTMKLIEESGCLKDVKGEYDGIFLPGGHGVVFDLHHDKHSIALVEKFWAEGKVVSAVCHGPCGLLNVKAPNGDSIFKGKKVAAFTNSEEQTMGATEKVPYLLETEIIKLGGHHQWSADFSVQAVADGNLVTGQNPGSSAKMAELVIAALA